MAFSESDRVQIRTYMGYAAIFLQADPRLESAISNCQAVQTFTDAGRFGYDPGTVVPDPAAVGGTRPDSSTENQIRLLVQKLQQVDERIDNLDDMMGVGKVDDGSFDPAREDARLRRKGRMYVYRLAKLLDTEPRSDVFSSSTDTGGNFGTGRDFAAGPAYPSNAFGDRARRAY